MKKLSFCKSIKTDEGMQDTLATAGNTNDGSSGSGDEDKNSWYDQDSVIVFDLETTGLGE